MKKTFGRLIIATLMIAVVLSVAAFAELPNFEPEEDGTYSITYENATAGQYYTMVVVEGVNEEGATPTISEDTVLYVGQVTAGSADTATFADWTPKTNAPASVYVGIQNGTSVEHIGYINNNRVKVYGTVSSMIPGGTKNEAAVTVKNADGETVATATTVNGEYAVYVPEGEECTITYVLHGHSNVTSIETYSEDTETKISMMPNHSANFSFDYDGDGVIDDFDYMTSANAAVSHYINNERTSSTMVYTYADGVITATLTPKEYSWGYIRQVVSFDKTVLDIAEGSDNYASAFVLPTGATLNSYSASTKGNIVTVDISYYYFENVANAASEETVLTITAPLASGKTADDYKYNTFTVDSIAYANRGYNYYKVAGESDNITVTNEFLAGIELIEIDVVIGDLVYLQDGNVIEVASDGKQQVPMIEGYVFVNNGKGKDTGAQKTYYIDPANATATLVHTNGVVGSDDHNLRDRTLTSEGEDRNGIRFQLLHNPATRTEADHSVVEVGFITTTNSNKVTARLENAGLSTDRNYITAEAVAVGAATSGAAYDLENGINIAFDQEDDEKWDIRAVFYNIPITESGVQTVITARPYYKVNGTYIYGEATSATLAQIAYSIKANTAAWDGCTDSMKDYVNEILALVGETEIVNEEIIIDITNLFAQLGLVA